MTTDQMTPFEAVRYGRELAALNIYSRGYAAVRGRVDGQRPEDDTPVESAYRARVYELEADHQ